MPGVIKALLWTALAAAVAVALVVGFGLFQLSQIYPDANEGRSLAEQIETDLVAEHPSFSVTTHAEASFADVRVTITPVDGQLREPEISELLASVQEVAAEHADSRWSLSLSIEGRWETSPVTIVGSDADRWPELSTALELATSSRTAISIRLDSGGARLSRDLDTERLCGEGTPPRNFFTDTLGEASDALTELGWTAADSPGLLYAGHGCEGPLRLALDLSGEDRLARVQDLQTLVGSLPTDAEFVGITVQQSGELEVAFEDEPTDALSEAVVRAWPHGEVWINGSSASGS